MIKHYLAQLQWTAPVVVQWFWYHVLRYRVIHLILGFIVLVGASIFVVRTVSDVFIQDIAAKIPPVVDQLYMTWLEIQYDPTVWIATNMSWPVVWTTKQVMSVFDSWNESVAIAWPKNILTIDTTATVEDFASYDTMMLLTQKYLIAQSTNDMRIIPLVGTNTEISTGVVITKTLLTELSNEWVSRLTAHGSEIRRTLVYIALWGWVILLPFLAIGMVGWLSVGMLLITLLSWWVSKLRVRVGYWELFTRLSLTYLPLYLLLKLLTWLSILPSVGVIGYLAMVACLAVYIVRVEDSNENKEKSL